MSKEMSIDFYKHLSVTPSVVIKDQAVELVHKYKYLGTDIDDKLSFDFYVDAGCKKAHQRFYLFICFRELLSFNVDSTFMKVFHSCFIESVLMFILFLLFAITACFLFKTETDCRLE